MQKINCRCECGSVELRLTEAPFSRFYCHCETCQEVYQQPFADITLVNATAVEIRGLPTIEYRRYSENVERGICKDCRKPIIARIPEMSSVVLVPAYSYSKTDELPGGKLPVPKAHLYYHRAQQPVDDSLEKVSGAKESQLMALEIFSLKS